MPKLPGTPERILRAILEAEGEGTALIEDTDLAKRAKLSLRGTREALLAMESRQLVGLSLTSGTFKASLIADTRLALRQNRLPPTTPPPHPSSRGLAESGQDAGRDRALVIGIGDYPSPIPPLPAVANDVREMAKLLSSGQGEFSVGVKVLTDEEATSERVLKALEAVFHDARPGEAVFVYLAGHGDVADGEYFFIAHNTKAAEFAKTAVPLKRIKEFFDASPSERAFLWLDFCHSGGITARDFAADDDQIVIGRTLRVVQGAGKLIISACTPAQKAYDSDSIGHGLFTGALLQGLKGDAAWDGEVTINSLYDFIDKQIGSDRQRPVMFGEMTGRIVLVRGVSPSAGRSAGTDPDLFDSRGFGWNEPSSKRRSVSVGTWIFGPLLLSVLIWACAFAPPVLPQFRLQLLALFSALLAGLFGYFFIGDFGLVFAAGRTTEVSHVKTEIRGTGGFLLFVIVLFWWSSRFAPIVAS